MGSAQSCIPLAGSWCRCLAYVGDITPDLSFIHGEESLVPNVCADDPGQIGCPLTGEVICKGKTGIRDRLEVRSVQGVGIKKADELVTMMSEAVAEISAFKDPERSKPMLGSKVMHFFLPAFFPVWDTAYVDQALRCLRRKGEITLEPRTGVKANGNGWSKAAETYAQYVRLMLADLREAEDSGLQLGERLIEHATREYSDNTLRMMIEQNLGDLSPVLFELGDVPVSVELENPGPRRWPGP